MNTLWAWCPPEILWLGLLGVTEQQPTVGNQKLDYNYVCISGPFCGDPLGSPFHTRKTVLWTKQPCLPRPYVPSLDRAPGSLGHQILPQITLSPLQNSFLPPTRKSRFQGLQFSLQSHTINSQRIEAGRVLFNCVFLISHFKVGGNLVKGTTIFQNTLAVC